MAAQGIGVASGVTVQVHVGDLAAGVRFYSALLGRGPDVAPHEDFREWELSPGAWLQLAEGDGPLPHPLESGPAEPGSSVHDASLRHPFPA